jgi:hypothetical protein
MKFRLSAVASFGLLAAIAGGCEKQAEIVRYEVPRAATTPSHPLVEPQPGDQRPGPSQQSGGRMLTAIIARGETTWFFKLTGPEGPVAQQSRQFRTFTESVRFPNQGVSPTWKLPEGWREQPGSGMRHATILVPTPDQALELTVTPLKKGTGDFEDYVLANVDRWRQQVGLPPTSKEKLFGAGGRPGELVELTLQGTEKALMVDLVGQPGTGSAGVLASTPPSLSVGPASIPPASNTSSHDSPLTYKAPAGWSPGKVDGLRQVAFEVRDGSKRAEFTVVALAASAGDLLANVNRWREQVHLGPVARGELEGQLKEFPVDSVTGRRVELVAPAGTEPRETILGVISTNRDKAWFFKLKGDSELVAKEQERFDSFVRSVRFDGGDGAHDGH